jgi:hypothetical protein
MNITKLPEITNLKLKTNSALFWGEDSEDVKVFENISRNEFEKIADQFDDYAAYYSGYNDDEMFEIIFSMNDECAYDLIEDYYKEWGYLIEIISE